LRQFVQACSPQDSSNFGDAGIYRHLKDPVALAIGSVCFCLTRNEPVKPLSMHSDIIVHVHRSELDKYKWLSMLAIAFLLEEHGTF
jgi:hypothetical protein